MDSRSGSVEWDGAEPRREAVERAILNALRRVCEAEGIDPATLAPSASLVRDVGIDSLVFVELMVALEEELGFIDFPLQTWADEQASKQQSYTLESLVDYAERWLVAAGGAPSDASARK